MRESFPDIPGYRIKKELGRGGMARVFLAFDEKLGRKVALKVLFPGLAEDRQVTKRFIKEAKLAAKLSHLNIIHIYDVGKLNNHFFIAMELVENRNLKEDILRRYKSGSAMGPDRALFIIRQVASALDYAHKSGIVHRDIKPENILFRSDDTPVIADFGIARAMDSNTRLTATGISIGSPHYMSPEQVRGEKLDGRTDIYSLGVVLYEMLTGQTPYHAQNTVAVVIKHLQEAIPRLPKVLCQYQFLIDRMMAKNPDERIANATALIQILDGMMTGKSFVPEPDDSKNIPEENLMGKGHLSTKELARRTFVQERKKLIVSGLVFFLMSVSLLLQTLGIMIPFHLWLPLLSVLLIHIGSTIIYLDINVRQKEKSSNIQYQYNPLVYPGQELIVFLGFLSIFSGTGMILAGILVLPHAYHWRLWPGVIILFLLREIYLALKYR